MTAHVDAHKSRLIWKLRMDVTTHTDGTSKHAITQTQSLTWSGRWSLFTIGLGRAHMPVMNGIRVQVGDYSLIAGWVWHFTSLSITPTITSWHFCIRLIFRPLLPCSGEHVCLRVCVCVCAESGRLILLFTTTANIYSCNFHLLLW